MAKRRGEHARAAAIWEALLEDVKCRAMACEELAIYHERRTKDFNKSLEYAREGLKELRRKNGAPKYGMGTIGQQQQIERLTKRVVRLEVRIDAVEKRDQAPLLRQSRTTAAAE